MGIGAGAACYCYNGGSFLRGDIYNKAFLERGIGANGFDIRIYRQLQRMRGITAQGIFVQGVLYFMVGDSMRLLRGGHDFTGHDFKFGFLERRSQKASAHVINIL